MRGISWTLGAAALACVAVAGLSRDTDAGTVALGLTFLAFSLGAASLVAGRPRSASA